MTSPPLATHTVSPTRTSRRATSSKLCSVARDTVEPATPTGSSSATGVSTPVRPTWTTMSARWSWSPSGGYLKAIAQRTARAVAPRPRCSAGRSILTTTPSVSKSSSRRADRPVGDERFDLVEVVAPLAAGLTGKAQAPQPLEDLARGSIRSQPSRAHDLIAPECEPAARRLPRVEEANRSGGGVARVGELGLACRAPLSVEPLEDRCAACRPRRAPPATGGAPATTSGSPRMVRALAVTSSPTTPLPRVTARSRRPSLVDAGLSTPRRSSARRPARRRACPSCRLTRSYQACSSSIE